MIRGSFGHSLPPDAAVVSQSNVGEDGVLEDGLHGHRVAAARGAWGDSEEAVLRVDRPQVPILVEPQPGDVVTDAGDIEARNLGEHETSNNKRLPHNRFLVADLLTMQLSKTSK